MNPYEILGISPRATDDEIKRAYREQSRKYHPDSYSGNPLSGLAEEKFKQVQEAYDQIMKERNGGYGSSSYTSSYTNRGPQASREYSIVIGLLSSRRYGEALRELDRMTSKDAGWYYYSAIANVGLGNTMRGAEHARVAVNMDPGNPDYLNLLNQISFQSERYGSTRPSYGYSRSDDTMDLCCKLWLADSLCECLGGDLCSCM